MSATSEVVSSVGWHQHGSTWVWGIAENEGCSVCDVAYRKWLKAHKSLQGSLEDTVAKAVLSRKKQSAPDEESPTKAEGKRSKKSLKEEAKARQKTFF